MESKSGQLKILELLKLTENLFKEKSIVNPRLNAELLLSNCLNIERISLYTDFDKPLNETEVNIFREKVKRRLNFEPLQYILEEAHFYGKTFKVNPSVMIPRPETELLVEKTIELIRGNELAEPKILEIGTGSGCISISIASNVPCIIDAIDIDEKAVRTAEDNLLLNKTIGKINFSICDFITQDISIEDYDIIVSNPPYIPETEYFTLPDEIKKYEPQSALTDKSDGLKFYRRIFKLYKSSLKKPSCLLEIGDGKKDVVEKLVNEYSIKNYVFHKDLLNIYRVLEI